MSLVSTLGTMALGVVAAKAASGMLKGGGAGGGLGGMLGKLGGAGGAAGGLGGLLGGGAGGAAGGLGGLLGGAQQQGQQQAPGGLGGLLGGQSQQGGAGGLGGLLDSLGGGAAGGAAAGAATGGGLGGSLGSMLNAQLNGEQVEAPAPDAAQEDEAKLLIRAMINSAKCDGDFDASEQEKILKQVGEMSQENADFINDEINKPLDVAGFIASVPPAMAQQVYLMSILAIDLDSKEEAQYLDQLVKGFGMTEQQSNDIHAKLGVPTLYG